MLAPPPTHREAPYRGHARATTIGGMLPVRLAARSQLRPRRGATGALVLLVALAGGVDRADEAVIDDVTAARNHLHVGSRVTMRSFSAEQNNAVATSGSGKIPAPEGPEYRFRVVGIVRDPTTVNVLPANIAQSALYDDQVEMLLTPAFLRRFAHDQCTSPDRLPSMHGFRIRLRHVLARLPACQRSVTRIV